MGLLQLEDLIPAKPAPPMKGLEVTGPAIARITGMLQTRADLAGKSLRVYVTSGGCAGYSYGMAFDEPQPEDHVIEVEGLQVLMDPESYPWLKGIRVDYKESMMGSGFSITNPNAEATCGCGTSFSKADGASAATGH